MAAQQAFHLPKESKLEDINAISKQKLALESLQLQFAAQMELISELEGQIRSHGDEKAELEAKYEERVYFIDRENADRRAQMAKDYENQIRDIKLSRAAMEKKMALALRPPPSRSTGPALPPRKGAPGAASETLRGDVRAAVMDAQALEYGYQPEAPRAVMADFNPTAMAAVVAAAVVAAQKPAEQRCDFWYSNASAADPNGKLLVAFDVPGSTQDALNIIVNRDRIEVVRKLGTFEEEYIAPKYWSKSMNRMPSVGAEQRIEIPLPCTVDTAKQQIFYNHGTVYLSLGRLPPSTSTVVTAQDWANEPPF